MLSCYQLQIYCYIYKIFYVSLIITKKQKPTVDTLQITRKESKHTVTESINSQRKRVKEEESNKGTTNQLENSKMTLVYLAIIILNGNGLHSPIKMYMVAEWII